MPGGDRTGPAGMGPMTGRAAGYCAGYPVPGYMNPTFGRGQGRGRGQRYRHGWGRGRGGGYGWGWGAYPPPYAYGAPYYPNPYAQELTPRQEADMLKEQAKAMQDELKAINDHIQELESVAKKSK